MAELVVLGFPSKAAAEGAYDLLTGDLTRQQVIRLGDAALAWRDADGKPRVQQAVSTTGAGAAGGALWGTLIGALFLSPLLGAAVGAGSGALLGRLTDVGIDDDMIERIARTLEPGGAAVFLLVVKATRDRVVEALRGFEPTVLQTSLSVDDQADLVRSLSLEDAPGTTPERVPVASAGDGR